MSEPVLRPGVVAARLATARPLLDRDPARRLEPSAGLRNIVVHEHLDVDLHLLADAVGRALEDHGDDVRAVARWLCDRQGSPTSAS